MKSSQASSTGERPMERPLTYNQKQALNQFGRKWKQCPSFIHVATLMSLQSRGLIEYRTTMPYFPGLTQSYKSFVYEWRRAPSSPSGLNSSITPGVSSEKNLDLPGGAS